MNAAERLKCRWCAWTTLKFATGKDGKPRSGWNRLRNHIEDRHESEAMALSDALGPIEPWDAVA